MSADDRADVRLKALVVLALIQYAVLRRAK